MGSLHTDRLTRVGAKTGQEVQGSGVLGLQPMLLRMQFGDGLHFSFLRYSRHQPKTMPSLKDVAIICCLTDRRILIPAQH